MGPRIAIALTILAAMGLMLFLYMPRIAPPPANVAGQVQIGGPFTLIDSKGAAVTEAALQGHYSLIFFGFTHCPDICPLALQTVTQALTDAGPAGERALPVFISVDPERDTPEAMAAYASNFHPRLLALTGTPEQIAAVTKAYRVAAFKTPMKDANGQETGEYTVVHSSNIFVMGPDGKYHTHFDKDATAESIAAYLRKL